MYLKRDLLFVFVWRSGRLRLQKRRTSPIGLSLVQLEEFGLLDDATQCASPYGFGVGDVRKPVALLSAQQARSAVRVVESADAGAGFDVARLGASALRREMDLRSRVLRVAACLDSRQGFRIERVAQQKGLSDECPSVFFQKRSEISSPNTRRKLHEKKNV